MSLAAWETPDVPPRFFEIVEREHDLQNPTSTEKLLELGERLRLGSASEVLDAGSGRGGPAVLLAREFGCRVRGIELRPEFHAAAVERAAHAGVGDRVRFELRDAADATFVPGSFDVVMCLGATFVWGGLAGTLDALEPVVRPGGHLVVGEPFWRRLPLPRGYGDRDAAYTTLEGTVAILESGALRAVTVIVSSEDDWDRYETLHWRAAEEWLVEHPAHDGAAELRAHHERAKRSYLRYGRDHVGWALLAGSKPPQEASSRRST